MSKDQSLSKQPTSSLPLRAPRSKSIPKRLDTGIDRHIPGIGITIPEASSPNPKKRGTSSRTSIPSSAAKKKKTGESSKEQGKRTIVPQKARSKRASTTVISSPSSVEVSGSSSETESEQDFSLVVANAVEEIKIHKNAPEGFKVTPVLLPPSLNAKFKDLFGSRGFCTVTSVDLEQVYRECNVNLSPWFGPYATLVSIEAAYCPELVKMFYFNMATDHILDSEGRLIEERVTTSVRGVRFTLSAAILNKILKVVNPPEASTPKYSNEEVYATLLPGQDIPDDQRVHLTFKPSEMPHLHRVIWYVYSCNFVQKGGSYTHFTQKDYRFFTAFIRKHPLNIGQWLFKEISHFRFVSRKGSYMPFASLVSLIMYYHKIWYVGPPEQMKFIPTFGKTQLNLMKIQFEPEGSGQSRAPPRSPTRASQSVAHEAQSAPPPLPSDFDERIRAIVDAALVSHRAMMKAEFDMIRADIKLGVMDVIVTQSQVLSELVKVKDAIDDQGLNLGSTLSVTLAAASDARDKAQQLLQHFGLGGSSSSSFGFTTGPSSSTPVPEAQPSIPVSQPSPNSPEPHFSPPSSPTFSFPSPPHSPPHTSSSPVTPTTEILPGPFPSPPTPSTEIFPTPSPYAEPHDPSFDPNTAMVLYSPHVFVLDPEFVDDKGGEGEKDVDV